MNLHEFTRMRSRLDALARAGLVAEFDSRRGENITIKCSPAKSSWPHIAPGAILNLSIATLEEAAAWGEGFLFAMELLKCSGKK
jgi:hypothetical protein